MDKVCTIKKGYYLSEELRETLTKNTMKTTDINYKGYKIIQRIDVKSHCASIYACGVLVKMIAGDINQDGTNNAIDKSKKFIDTL